MDFLAKIHCEEKKTIIMVTHDEHVADHADRVEFLKDGTIVKTKIAVGKKRVWHAL